MEKHEDSSSGECLIISSDEELLELEPPITPSAPLTPGAQLEVYLQGWSGSFQQEENWVNHYTSCLQDTCDLDTVTELQHSEPQDHLQLVSPLISGWMPRKLYNSR